MVLLQISSPAPALNLSVLGIPVLAHWVAIAVFHTAAKRFAFVRVYVYDQVLS